MMFVVRGPVMPDSPVHVERSAALATVARWFSRSGCVVAILGARQTGKTSFCYWMQARLGGRYAFSYIDFQGFDGNTWDECVEYIATRLLRLYPDSKGLAVPRKGAGLRRFLQQLVARIPALRVVVVFEELGDLPEACRRNLAQNIRAVFTDRLQTPVLQRYAFVIVGAYEVRDLAGTRNSPLWNCAEKLYLPDFNRAQVTGLLRQAVDIGDGGVDDEDTLERLSAFVHRWTAGHPYWTQYLARELVARHLPDDRQFVDDVDAIRCVQQIMRDEDTNLSLFFELLRASQRRSLRSTLAQIQAGEYSFTRSDKDVAILELLGAIREHEGRCVIRNRVYEMALEWHSFAPPVSEPESMRATLLNIDMVGYSGIARYLHYVVGGDAVGLLGESIRAQILAALHTCGLDDSAVHGFTGDGAILRFAEPVQAHEFAGHFHALVQARNRDIPDSALWRHYRMGAATGELVLNGSEFDGLVFTHAQRLESGGAPGRLLVDIPTWRALPARVAAHYQPEAEIEDKHGVRMRARCWIIPEGIPEGAIPQPILPDGD